jgi:D-alanyl-D-alanine carboxypeptidase
MCLLRGDQLCGPPRRHQDQQPSPPSASEHPASASCRFPGSMSTHLPPTASPGKLRGSARAKRLRPTECIRNLPRSASAGMGSERGRVRIHSSALATCHVSARGEFLRGPLFLVLICVLTACSSAPSGGRDPALVSSIDSIANLWLAVDSTPGISIAVVHQGDTLVMRGYGLADVEQQITVDDRTVFGIASVTKQFTAAAVMALMDEGRLRVDTPLGEVLQEYVGPGRSVTLHQLLNHTSGIPPYTLLGSRYWELRHQRPTSDQMVALFASDPLEFEPGSAWAYNNSAYLLLGLVIERVSGESYGDHLERTFFQPLRLEQTGVCGLRAIVPNRARGYWVQDGRLINAPPYDVVLDGGAGALCSTPRDLVRWARALTESQVVPLASLERMASPTPVERVHRRHPYVRSDQTLQPYGYGMYVGRQNGRSVVSHLGAVPGFRAIVTHYPQEDLTIAVLANGPAAVEAIQTQIAHRVLGSDPSY